MSPRTGNRWAISTVSVIYYVTGIGTTLANIAVFAYWLQHRAFPKVLGIRLNDGGPFSEPDRYPYFQSLFIAATLVEVVAARWLQQRRKRGGYLGLGVAVAGFGFGIGFQVPFLLVTSPLDALLIGIGWRTLSDQTDARQARFRI
jgi:hypothetical protein